MFRTKLECKKKRDGGRREMDKRDRRRHKIFMRGIYQNMVIFKRWTVDMVDIWYPGQDPMTYHSYHYRVIKNIEK